jgi:hypothetical protein
MIRKAAVLRRTALSYDRLMQVVAEQAMQRAMMQINRGKYGTPARAVFGRRELAPEVPDYVTGNKSLARNHKTVVGIDCY